MGKCKPKFRMMRFRKNDPGHNLLAAVQHYVHSYGGTVVVEGGIEVQDWGDGLGKYRVAVRCLGRAPRPPQDGGAR